MGPDGGATRAHVKETDRSRPGFELFSFYLVISEGCTQARTLTVDVREHVMIAAVWIMKVSRFINPNSRVTSGLGRSSG